MGYGRRMIVEGDNQDYILDYRLVPHHRDRSTDSVHYYGIQVEEYVIRGLRRRDDVLSIRRGDLREISGLTEDQEEAEYFLNMIAEGSVFPVSLYEIYDDWMSAFHPRWGAFNHNLMKDQTCLD